MVLIITPCIIEMTPVFTSVLIADLVFPRMAAVHFFLLFVTEGDKHNVDLSVLSVVYRT